MNETIVKLTKYIICAAVPTCLAALMSTCGVAEAGGGSATKAPPDPPPADLDYLELRVLPNASGTEEFSPGDLVSLSWTAYYEDFGYEDVPCAIYLGIALDPPKENQTVSVSEIMSSRALYLFNERLQGIPYDPANVVPTWESVTFPFRIAAGRHESAVGTSSTGGIEFVVPAGHQGNWAFAATFIRLNGAGFVIVPPVAVSNSFTIKE